MSEPISDKRLAEIRERNEQLAAEPWIVHADDVDTPIYHLFESIGDARDLLAEVDRLRTQVAEFGEIEPPADPDDVFLIGHTYRSLNEYFEFTPERRIGDIVLGQERALKAHHVTAGSRSWTWTACGPSVGYRDMAEWQDGSDGCD